MGRVSRMAPIIKNRRMRNRTYGGVRGRKTKVGRKLLRFPPTRLVLWFNLASEPEGLVLYLSVCQERQDGSHG